MEFPTELQQKLPEELRQSAIDVLSQDPRAGYDRGKNRDFRLACHGYDLVFASEDDKLIVKDVIKIL